MTTVLYALAEVATAALLFAAISLFNGWRQARSAANPFTVPTVNPINPKFPEIDLRPGGITVYDNRGTEAPLIYFEIDVPKVNNARSRVWSGKL